MLEILLVVFGIIIWSFAFIVVFASFELLRFIEKIIFEVEKQNGS